MEDIKLQTCNETAELVKTNIKVEDVENYNVTRTHLPVIKSYTNGKARVMWMGISSRMVKKIG